MLSSCLGRPSKPEIDDAISGPGTDEATIVVKTLASGLNPGSDREVFVFLITPILNGVEGESVAHVVPDYQSDTFETLTIGGLEGGRSYVFNVTATNRFGISQAATSKPVVTGANFVNGLPCVSVPTVTLHRVLHIPRLIFLMPLLVL